MPVTILDVAKARGAQEHEGVINGGELDRVKLAIMGGCETCGESLAAYNGYPSKSGFWRCYECLGDLGFETTCEFEAWEPEGEVGQ